jgi:hypothetical protein
MTFVFCFFQCLQSLQPPAPPDSMNRRIEIEVDETQSAMCPMPNVFFFLPEMWDGWAGAGASGSGRQEADHQPYTDPTTPDSSSRPRAGCTAAGYRAVRRGPRSAQPRATGAATLNGGRDHSARRDCGSRGGRGTGQSCLDCGRGAARPVRLNPIGAPSSLGLACT